MYIRGQYLRKLALGLRRKCFGGNDYCHLAHLLVSTRIQNIYIFLVYNMNSAWEQCMGQQKLNTFQMLENIVKSQHWLTTNLYGFFSERPRHLKLTPTRMYFRNYSALSVRICFQKGPVMPVYLKLCQSTLASLGDLLPVRNSWFWGVNQGSWGLFRSYSGFQHGTMDHIEKPPLFILFFFFTWHAGGKYGEPLSSPKTSRGWGWVCHLAAGLGFCFFSP